MEKKITGEKKGKIFNIQRFTIHDGPGIRTEIFFKGCPLQCIWCSNPEGLSPKTQIGIYRGKCIGYDKCALCEKACPSAKSLNDSPLHFNNGVIMSLKREYCPDSCLTCADICPASAIIQWGKDYSVDQLIDIIVADRGLYQQSGGGVTLSGGEVMLQWEFAAELLAACKKNYIHTCVESSLHCDSRNMESVYEYTDLVITDIKHMDSKLHEKFTGVGNDLIIENIRKTMEFGKKMIVRIPVIPGYNDDNVNISATGKFLIDCISDSLSNSNNKKTNNSMNGCVLQIQLLPYRKMGTDKYDSLNLNYPLGNEYIPPAREVWEPGLLRLAGLLHDMGLPAVAGSNVKYDA